MCIHKLALICACLYMHSSVRYNILCIRMYGQYINCFACRPNLVLLQDYIYSVIMRCLHCTMCILCVKYMQDVNTTASPTNMVTPFRQLMVATNG